MVNLCMLKYLKNRIIGKNRSNNNAEGGGAGTLNDVINLVYVYPNYSFLLISAIYVLNVEKLRMSSKYPYVVYHFKHN